MELFLHKIATIEQQIRALNDEKNKYITGYIQHTKALYPTVYVLFKVKNSVPKDKNSGMPGLVAFDPVHDHTYGCFSSQQLAEDYIKDRFAADGTYRYFTRPEASANVSDFRIFNIDKLFE